MTGYRAHSFFGVKLASGHGIGALPDWIQTEPTWDIDEDVLGSRNATVYATFWDVTLMIFQQSRRHRRMAYSSVP